MDAKQFLMQAIFIAEDHQAHMEELATLQELALACGAINYDHDRVISSLPQSARFEGRVIRLVDVIAECRQELNQLIGKHKEIRDVIAQVEDEQAQAALRMRYLARMEVDVIASKTKTSKRTVLRRLERGENEVARITGLDAPVKQRMPARERHKISREILREYSRNDTC